MEVEPEVLTNVADAMQRLADFLSPRDPRRYHLHSNHWCPRSSADCGVPGETGGVEMVPGGVLQCYYLVNKPRAAGSWLLQGSLPCLETL